jgi:hypothetical protein
LGRPRLDLGEGALRRVRGRVEHARPEVEGVTGYTGFDDEDPEESEIAHPDGPGLRPARRAVTSVWQSFWSCSDSRGDRHMPPLNLRIPARRWLTFSALQVNQVKDPGTFNQIARSKSSWIRQKSVQPFQTSVLNPNRRATLFSSKKVDRSTYTQPDPSGPRVVSNTLCENLLLRHSYRHKN